MLAVLGLGVGAVALTCTSPITLGTLLTGFVAATAGNIAGNLATDVYSDFDRAAADFWFDRFAGIDENHKVLEQLRLAHIRALQAVLDGFLADHQPGGDIGRAEAAGADAFARRLRDLCAAEQGETRKLSFGLHPETPAEERRLRTAFLAALPDAFDAALANRRQPSGAGSADAADPRGRDADEQARAEQRRNVVLAAIRQGLTDMALAELELLVARTAPPSPPGFFARLFGRASPPAASQPMPDTFILCFRGEPGRTPGWFDHFVLDAAHRLRNDPELAAIWNAEQVAAAKSLLQAQNKTIASLAEDMQPLLAAFPGFVAATKRIEQGVARTEANTETILAFFTGLDLQPGYHELASAAVARLPTALVIADYGIIPYQDLRFLLGAPGTGDHATLLGWTTAGSGILVRLHVAPGGQGKTRLALEAIARLNAMPNWRAGLLSRAALAAALERPPGSAMSRLQAMLARRGAAGIFLAIDYAETRPEQLRQLAALLEHVGPGGPVRIVLLARTDAWWPGFRAELAHPQKTWFETQARDDLAGAIAPADRPGFFHAACTAFAARLAAADALAPDAAPLLASAWPTSPVPPHLLESGSPLTLTLRAYLHVRARPAGPAGTSPLAEMAAEEQFHLARALHAAAGQPPAPALTELATRCAAAVTLLWGLSPDQGEAALHRLVGEVSASAALLPPASRMAEDARLAIRAALRRLYGIGPEAMRPILPDLIGEHMAGAALAAMPALLPLLLDAFPEDLVRILILANRLSRHEADGAAVHDAAIVAPARAALRDMFSVRLPLVPVAHAVVAAGLAEDGTIQDDAAGVLGLLPLPSRAAAAGALLEAGAALANPNATPARLRALLAQAATLADAGTVSGDGEAERATRARNANNRGIMLSNAGQREAALAASEEASGLYRELVAQNRAAFLPDLASALNNLGIRLSNLGRREEALAASEEAVKLRRELVAQNRAAFLPDLAAALNNLGIRLSNLGRREEALAASEEASGLYRELVAQNRAAFLPDLASALNNLGIRLSNLGRREEALAASEEAVKLRRELVAQNRAAFLPDLASALNNLGAYLSNLGRREEALAASEEAVKLRRELVAQNRAAFLPDLAGALNNLGAYLSNLGRREEALAASEEASGLYRELVAQNRAAFLPDLAGALNNLGIRLSNLGRREEALAASEEAAKLRRELVAQNRAAFLPDLAAALNNMSGDLSNLGRREEALAASEEAVKLRRELVAQNRAAFLPDLCMALGSRGQTLLAAQRGRAAADTFREAADLLRPLAAATPAAFGDLLAALAQGLARALQEDGRSEEIPGAMAELGVSIAPEAAPPALGEAIRLFESWVAAHNAAAEAQSQATIALAQQAHRELDAYLSAHAADPGLEPVRAAMADALRQISGNRPPAG